MTLRWHILTPELPPDCGGVGDYTAQVAEALAGQGDGVAVYGPPAPARWSAPRGVDVITLEDCFGARAMRALSIHLDRDPSSRLLVQYVPAVFGRGGANLPFCRWLQSRRRGGADVRVMFHEPYLYFSWRPDHVVKAVAQRAMARTLLDAATCVYISTDSWRRYLAPYGGDAAGRAVTLPIPSAIPHVNCPDAVGAARAASIGDGHRLIGHFGSYGDHVAPLVRRALYDLLAADSRATALCLGAGSRTFVERILADRPDLRGRLAPTGRVAARDLSLILQACDLLIQPYPDGVTTRRTSVMAGLANGRAVVTCDGPLTEHVWRETGAVALAPSLDSLPATASALIEDSAARASLEARGLATYASRFDLRHTIEALRRPASSDV